jgi:hypothetical protein
MTDQPPLDGLDPEPPNPQHGFLSHDDMLDAYGRRAYGCCGDCRWFSWHRGQGQRWFKCNKSNPTPGLETDWTGYWAACGKFERRGS